MKTGGREGAIVVEDSEELLRCTSFGLTWGKPKGYRKPALKSHRVQLTDHYHHRYVARTMRHVVITEKREIHEGMILLEGDQK